MRVVNCIRKESSRGHAIWLGDHNVAELRFRIIDHLNAYLYGGYVRILVYIAFLA